MASQEVRIRVLGFREDDMWCAIALEMDLRGYGETLQEAREELFEAIGCQISFAIQHDNLENIWARAPEKYFAMLSP